MTSDYSTMITDMNTYAPLMSGIVDSSIWQEEDDVRIVFITMLAKKDSDHVVRGTAFQIGRWANKTEAQVLAALDVLASPDTKRLEPQPFEGRRIERVDEGWLLLNGEAYKKQAQKLAEQARWRRAQANARLKKSNVRSPMSKTSAERRAEETGVMPGDEVTDIR